MRTLGCVGERLTGGGLTEGWGGFVGLIDFLVHIGHDTLSSESLQTFLRWGVRVGTLLQIIFDGQPLVQVRLATQQGQAWYGTHFMTVRYIQHWRIMRGKIVPVPEGSTFMGCSLRQRYAMVFL